MAETHPPRVLIPTGFGLNCERETALACRMVGFETDLVHISDLSAGKVTLSDYRMVVIIGGFSFGDHLGAGKVLSIRLLNSLPESLGTFVDEGGLLLGICNGFQTLVKMRLLPRLDGDDTQTVTVTGNERGCFHDGWVTLAGNPDSPCVFTRGLERLDLPVRHGEGRVVTSQPELRRRLVEEGHVPLYYIDPQGERTEEYPHNPNGSPDGIAGLCDMTGRVFGMMPHPEAYHSPLLHPQWPRQKREGSLPSEGPGLIIFRNAFRYLTEH